MMKVQLLKDIVSLGKLKTIYGFKNEVLNVTADKGKVLIVKGKKELFPVKLNEVKIIF